MLFQMRDVKKDHRPLRQIHRGRVLSNDDPDRLGRVRCYVSGLFEDESNDGANLPWISPLLPTGLGGRVDLSGFAVPEVGSEVLIRFPQEDAYHGVYFARGSSEITRSPLFLEDYPETYGWVDSSYNWLRVNKSSGRFEIRHSSGFVLEIDSAGNVRVVVPGEITLDVGGSVWSQVGGNHVSKVDGDCSVQVSGVLSEDAGEIHHNTGLMLHQGSLSEKIGNLVAMLGDISDMVSEIESLRIMVDEGVGR